AGGDRALDRSRLHARAAAGRSAGWLQLLPGVPLSLVYQDRRWRPPRLVGVPAHAPPERESQQGARPVVLLRLALACDVLEVVLLPPRPIHEHTGPERHPQ